jgi:hypothetical protein
MLTTKDLGVWYVFAHSGPDKGKRCRFIKKVNDKEVLVKFEDELTERKVLRLALRRESW